MKPQDHSSRMSIPGQSVAEAPVLHPGDKGLVSILSSLSVEETVAKIEDMLWSRGIKLFAVIDFSEKVHRKSMAIPPTKLILFGDARTVGPVIRATPEAAIDLPLKLLVRQDEDGRVWISHNTVQYLKHRHGLPEDVMDVFGTVETLATRAVE